MKESFEPSTEQLQDLSRSFTKELRRGLNEEGAMLKALPTFITRLPSGNERGEFLVVDLGGSNLRVGRVVLEGQGRFSLFREKWLLNEQLKRADGKTFFDFIAGCIVHFLHHSLPKDHGEAHSGLSKLLDGTTPGMLGFTFSYPVRQRGLQHGELIQWNKALECNDVVGQDVVALLEASLKQQGLGNIRVGALLNDTVGTMVAHAYVDPATRLGVILGTGTNAAYVEDVRNIGKLAASERGEQDERGEKMVINVEWGAFGENSSLLPLTDIDRAIDGETINPGKQLFEKMVSGMYLGEVVRLLAQKEIPAKLTNLAPFSLDAADLSYLALPNQEIANSALTSLPKDTLEILQRLGHRVVQRSARLVGAALVGMYQALGSPSDRTVVAFDGSVYEYYPGYPEMLAAAVREICPTHTMEFQTGKDESIVGAAVVLATMNF